MSKINAVFVLMTFPVPSETFISNDILGFQRNGVDSTVYTLLGKHGQFESLVKQRNLDGIKIKPSTFGRHLKGCLYILLNPILFAIVVKWLFANNKKAQIVLKCLWLLPISFYVLKEIQKIKPDIVHLMWGHYPSIIGWLVKKTIPDVGLSMFLGAYDLELELPISVSSATKADVVWTHARVNVQRLLNLGVPEKLIKVAYRGVSLSSFPLRLDEKKPKIVSAGRLIKSKGFDSLLRVFKMVKSQRPEAELVILGNGPELDNLIALADNLGISESVKFKGHLTQEKVFKEMAEAQIFILLTSHKAERLPNVLKEAMACRCICLSSKSLGIEELLAHQKTGFVIPVHDLDQYANVCVKIFKDYGNYKTIQDNASELIRTSFNRDIIINFYMTKWREIKEEKSRKLHSTGVTFLD